MFLRACRNYGMKEVDVFQTQDLYETKAIYSVSIFKSIFDHVPSYQGTNMAMLLIKLIHPSLINKIISLCSAGV